MSDVFSARYSGSKPTYAIAEPAGPADQCVDRTAAAGAGAAETFDNAHSVNYAFPTADPTGTNKRTPTSFYGDGSAAAGPLAGLPDGAYVIRHFEKTGATYDVQADRATEFWLNEGYVSGGSWTEASFNAAGTDWTDTERAQIRYQLGLDGAAAAPTAGAPDPVVVLPPADPAYAQGYLLDQTPGTVYTFRRTAAAGTAGYGWSEDPWDVAADQDGMVEYAFAKGHTYEGSRAGGERETFTVPADADTFALPEMLSEAP